ncbi:IPT/TIG domain-containing protein [Myxococcota bacterium]|nr:IPT/TIG domain-containing protein [Myxococcota bacterium]
MTYPRPHLRSMISLVLGAGLAASCGAPTEEAELAFGGYALVTAVEGFDFYPPLAPEPTTVPGVADMSLLAELEVVLERTSAPGVYDVVVARFTRTTAPTLQAFPQFERYFVNVPASQYFLEPTSSYRYRVLRQGFELARADVPDAIFPYLRKNPAGLMGIKFRIAACDADERWSEGACAPRCPSDAHFVDGACEANVRACTAENGAGDETWVNGAWGSCVLTRCDAGFHLDGAACVADVRSCAITNGSGEQRFVDGAWSRCEPSTCDAGFVLERGACVTAPVASGPVTWQPVPFVPGSDTQSRDVAGSGAFRSSRGLTGGRYYWEIHAERGHQFIGVASPAWDGTSTGPGAVLLESLTGLVFPGRIPQHGYTPGAPYSPDRAVGVALDLDAGEVTFLVAGQRGPSLQLPLPGPGPWYAAVLLDDASALGNFGHRDFFRNAPQGYRSIEACSQPAEGPTRGLRAVSAIQASPGRWEYTIEGLCLSNGSTRLVQNGLSTGDQSELHVLEASNLQLRTYTTRPIWNWVELLFHVGGQYTVQGPVIYHRGAEPAVGWRPSDAGRGVFLLDEDQTAQARLEWMSENVRAGLRATVGRTSGRWYWEVSSQGAAWRVGIASSRWDRSLAQTNEAVMWDGPAAVILPAGEAAPVIEARPTIGIALDLDHREVTFLDGHRARGPYPLPSDAEEWFPALVLLERGQAVAANFGRRPFILPVVEGWEALQSADSCNRLNCTVPTPIVTNVRPASVRANTTVTLTIDGRNLADASTVTLGPGWPCTTLSLSATKLRARCDVPNVVGGQAVRVYGGNTFVDGTPLYVYQSTTGVTWSPDDMIRGITSHAGDTGVAARADFPASTRNTPVFATRGLSTGRWVWEVYVLGGRTGVAAADWDGVSTDDAVVVEIPDYSTRTVQVALDLDAREVTFLYEGPGSNGPRTFALPPHVTTWWPVVQFTSGSAPTATSNFGRAPLLFGVPYGYETLEPSRMPRGAHRILAISPGGAPAGSTVALTVVGEHFTDETTVGNACTISSRSATRITCTTVTPGAEGVALGGHAGHPATPALPFVRTSNNQPFPTWRTDDARRGVFLTDGDLVASPRGPWQAWTRTLGLRGTHVMTSGRWYWEVTTNNAVGVADAAWDGTRPSPDALLPVNTSGGVIGVALDLEARTMTLTSNAGASTFALPAHVTSFVPAVFIEDGSATANFGTSPFRWAPPGFLAPLAP